MTQPIFKFLIDACRCGCSSMVDFIKDPSEQFAIGLDLTDVIPLPLTIFSVVSTATDLKDNSDKTSTVIASAVAVNNTEDPARAVILSIEVKAGTIGHIYKIDNLITLSDGQKIKKTASFRVKQL